MNWFLAKIVYRIICGEGLHTAQFDEQLRLIMAADNEAAFRKAKTIGVQEQTSFYNVHQKLVQWQFVNVAELHSLQECTDGAEVFSKIWEMHDPNAYINEVNEKARGIQP